MSHPKSAVMTERFLSAITPRVAEAAYGHHELSDYGLTFEAAWMSDEHDAYVFSIAVSGDDERREDVVQVVGEPADAVAALDKSFAQLLA